MKMNKKTCPNCGASLDGKGVCHYCNNDESSHDYTQQLKATRIKHEIGELQLEISKEQKEINKLLENNSPNGCLKIGMSIVVVAIVIIAVLVTIFRGGDGIGNVGIGSIIVLPIMYAICKFCDRSGNEGIQKKINAHRRNIKKLTKEMEEIQNGIG